MPKIADIASIRNGFAFRGRIESDRDGDTRVIQASDLTHSTELDMDELACVQLGAKKAQRYHLSEDSVVFMARGTRQRAYRPIRQPVSGKPVITALGLLVIRPNKQQALTEYLHWVLNTPRVQQQIQSYKEGTNIAFISERNLGHVGIPLPPLDTQRQIVQLMHLHQQRTNLREKLATMDEQITQATAWSLATEKQP